MQTIRKKLLGALLKFESPRCLGNSPSLTALDRYNAAEQRNSWDIQDQQTAQGTQLVRLYKI
jgi:hypothetical protein